MQKEYTEMYYAIVTGAVVMFGIQFWFSHLYEKENGNDLPAALILTLLSSAIGAVFLLILNGFSLQLTWFTLLTAAAAATNSMLCSFCTLKALNKVNLSLYSLFSMLGGMTLPLLAGLLFYNDSLSFGLILCVILIVTALILTVNKEHRKGGLIYFAGVFCFNGMSGVISKFFESAPFEKASAAAYSVWVAILSILISGCALICIRKRVRRPNKKAVLSALTGGTLNQIANYILLIALAVLPVSAQYSFVTGGVIIISTLISALSGQKPTRKELIGVAISFIGILALILL